MILASAVAFGMLTPLARIAYDGGSNAITVALTRSGFAVVACLLICLVLKREWRLTRQGTRDIIWVALGQTGMSIFYLGAVQYISVSLGAILFYTFPILVLIIEAMIRREIPGRIRIAAFVLAFAGLVLALGPSFESMDWRGIAFGVCASLSATLLFFATKRARRSVNETALVVWANALGIPIILLASTFMGGINLPETNMGWTGLGLACLFFASAFLAYTVGLHYTVPSRAAMYFNLEPVVTVIAAGILLSELLTSAQIAGALLVLSALIISAWRENRRLGKTGD